MSRRKSGWLKIHHKTIEPPPVPSAWDKMLRELQLSEAQALELLADRKDKAARRITAFVQQNKEHKFVPECVLSRLGEATW